MVCKPASNKQMFVIYKLQDKGDITRMICYFQLTAIRYHKAINCRLYPERIFINANEIVSICIIEQQIIYCYCNAIISEYNHGIAIYI